MPESLVHLLVRAGQSHSYPFETRFHVLEGLRGVEHWWSEMSAASDGATSRLASISMIIGASDLRLVSKRVKCCQNFLCASSAVSCSVSQKCGACATTTSVCNHVFFDAYTHIPWSGRKDLYVAARDLGALVFGIPALGSIGPQFHVAVRLRGELWHDPQKIAYLVHSCAPGPGLLEPY